MSKRVAILQSNYIPWRGYFDIIARVDDFVFYDEVQYTKNDWRNRNRIKTPQGVAWLTVPTHASTNSLIADTKISNKDFVFKHWRTLQMNYSRANSFNSVADLILPVYEKSTYEYISNLNYDLIISICNYIGIKTRIHWSQEIKTSNGKNLRLVEICKSLEANIYVSGPAARQYLDVEMFESAGISVEWFDYSGYTEYPQLWGTFEPQVSILDLLFNCGPESAKYLRYFRG